MYDELANILLYDAGWLEQGITQTEHDIAEHLKKAAEAIEELSKRVEGLEAAQEISPEAQHFVDTKADSIIDGLQVLLASVKERPRWIPVTEQKPPLPEDEDVCCVQVIGAVKGRKEAEPVLYSRAYRHRDGKRVRIERFVGDGEVLEVTHWMLMPEPPQPPKEEE